MRRTQRKSSLLMSARHFDNMNRGLDDLKRTFIDFRLEMREDMREMRNMLFHLYVLFIFGFGSTAVLILFGDRIFR